jgi:hypothetical protein
MLMAVEKRFLTLSAKGFVDGSSAAGQPQREQKHLRAHPAQIDPQIGEIDLGFRAGQVSLRDEPSLNGSTGLRGDLGPPLGDVVAHRGIGHLELMLVDQPGQHPPRGVTLLARRIQILAQHPVDQRFGPVQPRRRKLPRFAWWWRR